jgi:hypothetical protein
MNLAKRIEALEARRDPGLQLILISWMPAEGRRETATYAGTTYVQEQNETREQFRVRLGERVRAAGARFLFVDEIDARL